MNNKEQFRRMLEAVEDRLLAQGLLAVLPDGRTRVTETGQREAARVGRWLEGVSR